MADTTRIICKPRGLPAGTPSRFELSDVDLLMPNVNVPIFFVFPFKGDDGDDGMTSRKAAVASLCAGLERTAGQFPIQAGCIYMDSTTKRPYVQREDIQSRHLDSHERAVARDEESGYRDRDSTDDGGITMHVAGLARVLTDGIPAYKELLATGFPPSALPLARLLPLGEFDPAQVFDVQHGGLPACLFQVSFVRGGLILGCSMSHLTMDMDSIDLFMKQWAWNARCEDNNGPGLIEDVVFDRSLLTAKRMNAPEAQIDKWERSLLMDGIAVDTTKPGTVSLQEQQQRGTFDSAILSLDLSAVDEVRRLAQNELPSGVSVSIFDCVAALMWRCVSRAKLGGLAYEQPNDILSTLYGLTSFRESPPFGGTGSSSFPVNYFGNAVFLKKLGQRSLNSILQGSLLDWMVLSAMSLHTAGAKKNEADHGKRRIFFQDLSDWSGTRGRAQGRMWAAGGLGAIDLNIGSYMNLGCYESYDFGFGLPSAVRAPDLGVEWCCIYPPRRQPDGNDVVEMYLGLEEGCHNALEKDKELQSLKVSYIRK